LPEHLPVEEEVIIPLEVQAEPEAWREMGEEVSEQLDYRPARYLRKRLVRKKFVSLREPGRAPVIAPLPAGLQERCLAAPGMIAHVITAKYCDHLPLYRQEEILKRRHQITLPRQTMMGWLALAEFWLRPIYELIKTTVLDGNYVQVDETPVRYLCPGHGQTKLGYLWTVNRPRHGMFFHWETSRGGDCLERVVPPSFGGIVQCDGYAAYPAFVRERVPKIELAGCWAHVRRKFYEAHAVGIPGSVWVLRQIGELYRIEDKLRAEKAGPALREGVRASQSRPIVRRIGRVLRRWQEKHRFLPRSAMGQAISYSLRLWPQLERFLENGQIEIDNNLVENAIRPTALGKKNWLFIGAARTGGTSAILYTVIEECRRLELNPEAYLTEALIRLPAATNRDLPKLTPAALAPLLTPPEVCNLRAA
jgi:transposase